MDVAGIGAVQKEGKAGEAVSGFVERIAEHLQKHEVDIQSSFKTELDSNGVLFGIPDHIKSRFDEWESQLQTPDQQRMLTELKSKMTEMAHFNDNYIRDQAAVKAERFQLEIAMKAAGKAVSGIQQLLSSQ